MNSGYEKWLQALDIIPGGNGLLSKRPERYCSQSWPTYFEKASGCQIWDLDGNEYIDMAQNGIGSCILGYSNNYINERVISSIKNGVNTTLNAPEEIELAKSLLLLNPEMQSVKFARGGGEAMAIAVRIARAYAGKSKIAFSGYHGWNDWYLAANLESDTNLNDHLLPGLKPNGVPLGLKGTAIPFIYNDINSFEAVINKHPDIGTIVLEGARYDYASIGFIECIKETALKRGIVVIFDEITSGFRINGSGIYLNYGITPDIAVYGKALGNGFAISAIVGKKNVMNSAESTFISSTMWTERVGFAAGIATLEQINNLKIYNHLESIGTYIGKGWLKTAKMHNLDISISECKQLISFKFSDQKISDLAVTYFTQEMLKKGYLAASSVYVTSAHNKNIVDRYMNAVNEVFKKISRLKFKTDFYNVLEVSVRSDSFKRLDNDNWNNSSKNEKY